MVGFLGEGLDILVGLGVRKTMVWMVGCGIFWFEVGFGRCRVSVVVYGIGFMRVGGLGRGGLLVV